MNRAAKHIMPLLVMSLLAGLVALASLRYGLPHPPMVPPNVAQNRFISWLPAHAMLSAIALLAGAIQFQTNPVHQRKWHRRLGQIYVVCCLLSAPIGLLLAIGTSTGWVSAAGFGALSLSWFASTARAYKSALIRDFPAHRRWMIRSYALTFAAVTLRLYLPLIFILRLDFVTAYRAISFLCWIPNLVLVELWFALAPKIAADQTV